MNPTHQPETPAPSATPRTAVDLIESRVLCVCHWEGESNCLLHSQNWMERCAEKERESTALRAELEQAKRKLNAIYAECDAYADGAPDASLHDKLANHICGIIKP